MKSVLWMIVLAFAANIMISVTTYQAEIGSAVNVTNGVLATDKGFSTASSGTSSNGTSCSSPIIFGSTPQTANTNINPGDWVFDVQVNSTNTASPNASFNVTFVLASNSYGPLCIRTPNPAQDGQTIDCKFDVGTSLPLSPYTYKITVQ